MVSINFFAHARIATCHDMRSVSSMVVPISAQWQTGLRPWPPDMVDRAVVDLGRKPIKLGGLTELTEFKMANPDTGQEPYVCAFEWLVYASETLVGSLRGTTQFAGCWIILRMQAETK